MNPFEDLNQKYIIVERATGELISVEEFIMMLMTPVEQITTVAFTRERETAEEKLKRERDRIALAREMEATGDFAERNDSRLDD